MNTHSCTNTSAHTHTHSQTHIAEPTNADVYVDDMFFCCCCYWYDVIVGGADDGGDCSSDIAIAAAAAAVGVSPSLFYPSEHQLLHFFFNSFNITNFFRGCCCCHNCYCLLFVSELVFFSFFFEFHEMCFWILSSVSVDLDKFILTKRTYTNGDGGILDSIRCATKWISFHFILIYTRERLCILEYSCVCSVSSISENTHLHTYTMYVQSTAAAVAVAAATMVYSQQAACVARIISCRNRENRFFKGL